MAARLFRMRPVMRAWRQSFSGYSPFISLSRVFDRFAYHHLKVTRRDLRLEGCDGALLGQVEELQVAQGLVHIRGWAFAKTAEFYLSGVAVRDKVLSEGDADYLSFDIDLPYRAGPLEIRFETSRERAAQPVEVPLPEAAALARARAMLWGTFLTRLAWHGPGLAWALMRRDPSLTNRVKQALSLYDAELRERPIKPVELARPSDLSPVSGAVTLIVPVFNAFDLLPEMLQRVRENIDVTWRLIIIEDASTDARVRPFLRDWTARHRAEGCDVTLLENPSNLGFVKSVNAGFTQAMAFDDPVILLNSDAFVPRGWASRLLRALLSDPKVASATPFSNKAEIFSVPAICQDVDLLPGQVDEIDARLRARLAGFPIAAPTAVGFCMAMQRRFLDEVGLFDPAFGTGYGEEVDWCRKASRRGGRHVLAGNLFVEHRGAASFGHEVKQTRIQANNALISKRYPGYDLEVMNFIKSDPFLTQRLVAALAFLDTGLEADETVSVYVAHTLGGGAESYLAARIAQAKAAVILRLGGTERVSIEIVTRVGITRGATNDLDLVVDLLSLLSRRRIVYSCAVGDRDPAHIPDFLLHLSQEAALEVLFHDFFPLHPSYTLLDPDGVYRGTTLNPEVEAHPVEVKGRLYALDTWRSGWLRVLERASDIVAFSHNSKELITRVYPSVTEKIRVRPHHVRHVPKFSGSLPQSGRETIGVLGNIGEQKGVALIAAMSRLFKRDQRDMRLVVLGTIDPRFTIAKPSLVHGAYRIEDLPELIERFGISKWLIPSIWPETFSYTTHECLATGLPTFVFDLGAQAEAARQAPNGHLLRLPRRKVPAEALAARVLAKITAPPRPDLPLVSNRQGFEVEGAEPRGADL